MHEVISRFYHYHPVQAPLLSVILFLAVAAVSFALAQSESRRGSPFAIKNQFIGVMALVMAVLSLLDALFVALMH